jgi:hypothetical protein
LTGDDQRKVLGKLAGFLANTKVDDGLKQTAEMGMQKMVKRKASKESGVKSSSTSMWGRKGKMFKAQMLNWERRHTVLT